jgi:hypothetical protein
MPPISREAARARPRIAFLFIKIGKDISLKK